MSDIFFSRENLDFLLFKVHKIQELSKMPYYAEHSIETMNMVLDSAAQIAEKELLPLLSAMDREEPEYSTGQIRVHPVMKRLMGIYGEGGWISSHATFDEGGQQLPMTISNASAFILGAANYSASVYPFLSTGAANLIRNFGDESLKQAYVPKLFSGQWQGTMALTEPQAGSSLSDITTIAYPQPYGTYRIKGQKIYISCGDHDAVENVVHLLLARIEGAPAGIKGISLFVVPKRIEKDGALVANDVITAGIYHKMGYKGAPIAHLMFGESDNCCGFLVGNANKGLSYMFQMMNEARIAVGMSAASIASAAYYGSLEYAKIRSQGRKPSGKDLSQDQIPIIDHPDVRRMLLFQKATLEGSLSLLIYCSKLADIHFAAEGPEKERASLLLDILTPIAKTYPSEMGCLSTGAAVQILGGAGYLQDFPIEQFYRDMRIHPIHEGTTGIHGIDLLGRKIRMANGQALHLLLETIADCLGKAAKYPELTEHLIVYRKFLNDFDVITKHLTKVLHQKGPDYYLADASLYLELTGIMVIGWQWFLQICEVMSLKNQSQNPALSKFINSKLRAFEYYFEYEIPKYFALKSILLSASTLTVDLDSSEII
jgi:alkylation response protein AidB-like acyl-CoA dehydrogenase